MLASLSRTSSRGVVAHQALLRTFTSTTPLAAAEQYDVVVIGT